MSNQEILYKIWFQKNMPIKEVSLKEIGEFAANNKGSLKSSLTSKGAQITTSGFNYAVLKFILEYCSPSNWPKDLWEEFEKAKNPMKGNYAIWKKYPHLKVNINRKTFNDGVTTCLKKEFTPKMQSCSHDTVVVKSEFLNEEMKWFIEFIIEKIEKENILGKKGWIEQLRAYEWPEGKKNLKEDLTLRKYLNYLVNYAVGYNGPGADVFRFGVCNAVAGWGGLKKVEEDDCDKIFDSIKYLKRVIEENHDQIDCTKIFTKRIALSTKLYYFSDLSNWTIYDSRVAFTLCQLAYLFKKEKKEIFNRIKNKISFPIPPSKVKERRCLHNIKWNEWDDKEAAIWFVRASILLKAIANRLNDENGLTPSKVMRSLDKWELYLVEMVFFRLGKENWAQKSST